MSVQTSMLHVRVNEHVKNEAAQNLERIGLTLSDAVRILLTRIATDGGLPPGLVADNASYDAWFKAKVREAMNDTSLNIPHEQVMDEVQVLIDGKRANVAR